MLKDLGAVAGAGLLLAVILYEWLSRDGFLGLLVRIFAPVLERVRALVRRTRR